MTTVPFWVETADGVNHPMLAMSPGWAPTVRVFPEQIAAYEARFGSPVVLIAVDRIDNVVWRVTDEDSD